MVDLRLSCVALPVPDGRQVNANLVGDNLLQQTQI
jgi:hypothetical protein